MFILANLMIFLLRGFLLKHHFDIGFLFIANCLLFGISISSLLVQRKAMLSTNTQAFIRGVNVSMLIKLFVCMIAVSIYIFTNKGEVNQPALFSAMGLYVLYTAMEVTGLMKAARKKDA